MTLITAAGQVLSSLYIIYNVYFFCSPLGPVALSTQCKLIAPGAVVNGTMSITKSELYFEMDEDDPENKKLSQKVCVSLNFVVEASTHASTCVYTQKLMIILC